MVLLVLMQYRKHLIRLTEDEEEGTGDIGPGGAIPDVPTSPPISVNDAVAQLDSEYTAVRLDGEDCVSNVDSIAGEM